MARRSWIKRLLPSGRVSRGDLSVIPGYEPVLALNVLPPGEFLSLLDAKRAFDFGGLYNAIIYKHGAYAQGELRKWRLFEEARRQSREPPRLSRPFKWLRNFQFPYVVYYVEIGDRDNDFVRWAKHELRQWYSLSLSIVD